jgi:hypothetical protein
VVTSAAGFRLKAAPNLGQLTHVGKAKGINFATPFFLSLQTDWDVNMCGIFTPFSLDHLLQEVRKIWSHLMVTTELN